MCLVFGIWRVHDSRCPVIFSPKVLDKVMLMWKDGLLDADIAMQILGKGQQQQQALPPSTVAGSSDKTGSKKRSHDEMQTEPHDHDSLQSLDDVLQEAERAKKETCQ